MSAFDKPLWNRFPGCATVQITIAENGRAKAAGNFLRTGRAAAGHGAEPPAAAVVQSSPWSRPAEHRADTMRLREVEGAAGAGLRPIAGEDVGRPLSVRVVPRLAANRQQACAGTLVPRAGFFFKPIYGRGQPATETFVAIKARLGQLAGGLGPCPSKPAPAGQSVCTAAWAEIVFHFRPGWPHSDVFVVPVSGRARPTRPVIHGLQPETKSLCVLF